MLLQFSVTNHRSIKDTAIISLKASTDKSLSDCLISPDEKKQLVPVLALYGANAAGKSNVLHALLLMREMVCGRYAKLLKGESLPQEPFAFTDQPTQPTSFEAIYFYGGIKYAYHLAYSNPSFELWFLLHFVNQQTEVEDCQALIRLLKQPGRLPDYEKNKDYFDVLKPLQSTAIQRAKARAEQVRNQDTELISRQSNPLTTVWELVEYLNSKV